MTFPAEDLSCPDPGGCSVASTLPIGQLRLAVVAAGSPVARCYDANAGYADANPGYGDTRFAPFDDATGARVPVMYVAEDEVAALLESAFHDVDHRAAVRVVNVAALLGRVLAQLVVPRDLHLVDLRDAELDRLRLTREQLVSSSAEHYACTRKLAKQVHLAGVVAGRVPDGLLWHSRQSELAATAAVGRAGPVRAIVTVAVLFCDRVAQGRGSWQLRRPGLLNLLEGSGRQRLDEIAGQLDVTVVE